MESRSIEVDGKNFMLVLSQRYEKIAKLYKAIGEHFGKEKKPAKISMYLLSLECIKVIIILKLLRVKVLRFTQPFTNLKILFFKFNFRM